MNEADRITVAHKELDGCLVAGLDGVLDSVTYAYLRDSLVKLALEQPRAVVAQLDRLTVCSEALLSVFSSVWMRVNDWPQVPIFLVVTDTDRRAAIGRRTIDRFVPVFTTVGEAVAAVKAGAPRRRRAAVYPPVLMSSAAARAFVRESCHDWGVESLTADALCLASELVENAIEHARTELELRLELRRGMLTVAVRDGNPRQVVLRQDKRGQPLGYGLQIVADLAKAWGCSPDLRGGKVTWAVLTTGPRWFERHPEWIAPALRPWSP